MGGAQTLAVTMNEGVCLAAEMEEWRIRKRSTRYLDVMVRNLDEAIDKALIAKEKKVAVSIGWPGNAVDLLNRLKERGIVPDLLTDQTSVHDPLVGYFPVGLDVEAADRLRALNPEKYMKLSYDTMLNMLN